MQAEVIHLEQGVIRECFREREDARSFQELCDFVFRQSVGYGLDIDGYRLERRLRSSWNISGFFLENLVLKIRKN